MAHFARVSAGIVSDVHPVANVVITDPNGVEQESLGQAFLADLWGGDPADYIQCSYNATMRGAYPGVGYLWSGTEFVDPNPPMPEPATP
jgi:hypothetical protein